MPHLSKHNKEEERPCSDATTAVHLQRPTAEQVTNVVVSTRPTANDTRVWFVTLHSYRKSYNWKE